MRMWSVSTPLHPARLSRTRCNSPRSSPSLHFTPISPPSCPARNAALKRFCCRCCGRRCSVCGEYGLSRGSAVSGACLLYTSTAESGGKKNRPAQPQARRHGPKAGIQYLFLLAQNTHRNVENRRIVQRNHASVRPRLEVDTHAFFRLVLASEIVADGVYIDS